MLDDALRGVVSVMAAARDPWWVIGSAAVHLHGADTTVADVDILTSGADGVRLLDRLGVAPTANVESLRFRSRPYARLFIAALPIEIMGDLHVRTAGTWCPVRPQTRVRRGDVFIPDRAEMIAILRTFGREKDMRRVALLAAGDPS